MEITFFTFSFNQNVFFFKLFQGDLNCIYICSYVHHLLKQFTHLVVVVVSRVLLVFFVFVSCLGYSVFSFFSFPHSNFLPQASCPNHESRSPLWRNSSTHYEPVAQTLLPQVSTLLAAVEK